VIYDWKNMYEMMKKMNENLFDDIDLRYLQIINNLLKLKIIKNNNLKSN
jgi:hypothetical protein